MYNMSLTPFTGGFAAVAALLAGLFAFVAPRGGFVLLGLGLGLGLGAFVLLAV